MHFVGFGRGRRAKRYGSPPLLQYFGDCGWIHEVEFEKLQDPISIQAVVG